MKIFSNFPLSMIIVLAKMNVVILIKQILLMIPASQKEK